jgi:hypothetical protein
MGESYSLLKNKGTGEQSTSEKQEGFHFKQDWQKWQDTMDGRTDRNTDGAEHCTQNTR